jgi:predicted O-methyltransferase YrrM
MNYFSNSFKYIFRHRLSKQTRGFGVHSPFVFKFVNYVLKEKIPFYNFESIEILRTSLLRDKRNVDIVDFGTGNDRTEVVSAIARKSLKSAKYGQLMFRMICYFKAKNVLELGTSLGITTAYLAASGADIKCVSLEGCPNLAKIAQENFRKLGLQNIEVIKGDINQTLTTALNGFEKLDFVFFDANHQSNAVLRYFDLCLSKVHNDTVLIVDDIKWSKDMEWAWEVIKDNPHVTATIDLYQLGIVFFNADLNKRHYKMHF